jgi:hypothetical protein
VKFIGFDFQINGTRADLAQYRRFVGGYHLRLLITLWAPGERVSAVTFYGKDPIGFDDDFGFVSGLHSAFNLDCLGLWLWLK